MNEIEQRILDDLRLSPTAMVTCIRLRDWPRDTPVPEAKLADKVGVGTTAVRAALKQLEAAGWIEVRRPRTGGRFSSPFIHVHDTPRHTKRLRYDP
jgi:DNA-binding FadR family transcriptional regulator